MNSVLVLSKLIRKVIIPFFLFVGANVYSQETDCSKQLKRANNFFEEGNIEMVENLIQPCLDSKSFSKEDEVSAKKLLVLVHLFDDDLNKADTAMVNFLKEVPEYKVEKRKDKIEFVKLYESFKTIPSISFGITAGTNLSFIEDFTVHGVHPATTAKSSYDYELGYQFGVRLNKQFSRHLAIELGANFTGNSFKYTGVYYGGETMTTGVENQTWLMLPLAGTISFFKGRLTPYLGGGASLGYLLSAKGEYTLEYTNEASRQLPSTNTDNPDLLENRERLNFWLQGVVGFRYKIPLGMVFLEGSYHHNLKQQVVADERYNNSSVYFNSLYLDNDFYVDNLYISVGYLRSFYNPKKKRKERRKTRREGKNEI